MLEFVGRICETEHTHVHFEYTCMCVHVSMLMCAYSRVWANMCFVMCILSGCVCESECECACECMYV